MSAATVRRRARRTQRQYARHFAGKSRSNRDTALLAEMLDEQRKLAPLAAGLGVEDADLRTRVADDLVLFEKELQQIKVTQEELLGAQRGSLLGTLANHQFQLYRDHFASKSRTSRRPALLERMIGALRSIKVKMEALGAQAGDGNQKNLAIVKDRLGAWETELQAIHQARRAVTPSQMAGHLGNAANEIFAAYREEFAGKDRSTRDPERLSVLCDQLTQIELLMEELEQSFPDPTNSKNLGIVLANLDQYEREYDLVRQAVKR